MTQSFINPLSKFTTDTLKTLPYARMYFFENESSTPKEVFKNKAKTISWGFYATADSAGNFPPIWYDGVVRAELRNAAGSVQSAWPIDDIGTAQTFDTDIAVAGDVTAENLISTGTVEAGSASGFKSTSYTLNARNPIWSFKNASTYGISYFAGTPSIGTDDKIGIHFGTATIAGSEFTFDEDGTFSADALSADTISVSGDWELSGETSGIKFKNIDSADPKKLDYFEQGSFTPVIEGTTTLGVGTYSKQEGSFTRIGNVVYVTVYLAWSAHTGTGDMVITELPFYPSITQSTFSVSCELLTLAANKTLVATTQYTTVTIFLYGQESGLSRAPIAMDAAATINVTGFYFI